MIGTYDFGPGATEAFAGIGGFLLVFLIVFYVIMMGLCVLVYVLESLGMYTIAKRRGIHHSWLAWLPIGNLWILGSISDQYQYVVKGKVCNRRKVLLGLSIGVFGVIALLYAGIIGTVISGALDTAGGAFVGAGLAVFLLSYLALFVVAIVTAVFQYIAFYDLYASCDPSNAVLYLVLSVIFSIAMPFFVFSCRKKDDGMRSMQQPAYQQPQQPVYQQQLQEPAPQPEKAPEEQSV